MRASVNIDCPLCGHNLSYQLVSKEFLYQQRLAKCDSCGLVRLIGERSFHRDYWDDNAVSLDVYSNSKVRTQLRRRYERYLRIITRFCGRTGTLLDAGCGIGNFLVAAGNAGWRVAGVEMSSKAAAIARSRGLDVETARLEESRWPREAFDVITLWDLIEHLEVPLAAMSIVHEKLRPGGTVFLETPDEGFWVRPVLRGILNLSGGRIDLLRYFYYSEHRFYFSAATLSQILEKAGFRNVRVWHDVTLPAKAQLKIAPWRFPLGGLVLPLLPGFLGLMRRLGMGNKLMAAATKA